MRTPSAPGRSAVALAPAPGRGGRAVRAGAGRHRYRAESLVRSSGWTAAFVDWPWLSRVYGDDSGDLPAFQLGAALAVPGRQRPCLSRCPWKWRPAAAQLVGAVAAGELLYAGCAEELLLITGGGELVESVNASTGLPVPLTGIGLVDGQVVLQAGGTWWLADLDLMDFSQRAPAGSRHSASSSPGSCRRPFALTFPPRTRG